MAANTETQTIIEQLAREAQYRQEEAKKRSDLYQQITAAAKARLAIDQSGSRPLNGHEVLEQQVELTSPDQSETLTLQLVTTRNTQTIFVRSDIYSPSTKSRNQNFLVGFPMSNLYAQNGMANIFVRSTYSGLQRTEQIESLLESINNWPYTEPQQTQYLANLANATNISSNQ